MYKIFLSPPDMGKMELEYIKDVFESNYIAPLGEFVNRFEKAVKDYTNASKALALSSGTAAIHLALRISGVGQGDRVLASTFTFIGSVAPILYQGAEPIFIDSDSSWNADPSLVEEAIIKYKPKAFILTHLYGQIAKVEEIADICDRYNVILIEDAAESLGATYNNRQSGTFGRFGIYSFNGNKIITTSGGGMLVGEKDDIEYAQKLSTQAREQKPWYEHTEYGYNYRMSNILAAVGVGQMESLDEKIKRRREIFDIYSKMLGDIEGIEFMPEIENSHGNRWLTTLTLPIDPSKVIKVLQEHKIESRYLWKPMHMQPLFKDAIVLNTKMSERLFEMGICLPSGSSMSNSEVEMVADIVRGVVC